MRAKVTVVGAGNVGATTAQRLVERGDCDVMLLDIVEGLPQGKALDMLETGPVIGYDSQIIGTNSYDDTSASDIVIVTSGMARKPGMSRDDLVITNATIIASVTREIASRSPNAVIIMVTNPLDAMAQLAREVSGFPRERLIGMAGVLDTARFRTFIAQEIGASVHDVQAYVLGGHGDMMVPLTRLTTVAGVPVSELIAPARLEEIVQRARDGGAEIVSLLKTSSAYYAPSAAAAHMANAVLNNTREVMPCSIYLQGEYGIDGLYTGVPCRLGADGVRDVVPLTLTDDESAALHRSAASVKELVDLIASRRHDIVGSGLAT